MKIILFLFLGCPNNSFHMYAITVPSIINRKMKQLLFTIFSLSTEVKEGSLLKICSKLNIMPYLSHQIKKKNLLNDF